MLYKPRLQVLMKTGHMDHLHTYHNASLYTHNLNFTLSNSMKKDKSLEQKSTYSVCSEHVNSFIDAYWAHVRKRA